MEKMPFYDLNDASRSTKVVFIGIPHFRVKFSSAKTMAPPAIMSSEEGGVNIPLSGLLTVLNDPSVQAITGLMLKSDIHWSSVEIKVPGKVGS